MFDWNDLKYLLAVARHGSTLAAARHLEVNQSTVQRRLTELEERLGLRLVERSPSGYGLTPAGALVLPSAEHVAVSVEAFQLKAAEAAHASILLLPVPNLSRSASRNPASSTASTPSIPASVSSSSSQTVT